MLCTVSPHLALHALPFNAARGSPSPDGTPARTLDDGNPLVFPTVRGKLMNDMTLSGLLRTLEIPAVPHGFRSTFRDWAAEKTNHPREVVEAALAHIVQNKVAVDTGYVLRWSAPKRGRVSM